MLKESIIQECISVLKRDDFNYELKNVASPLIDMILVNIYPYLYTNMVLHPHYKRPNKNHPLTYYIWQRYVHKAWNRLS